ncbi:hypothetical protein [Bradyrhizobium guangdongense]
MAQFKTRQHIEDGQSKEIASTARRKMMRRLKEGQLQEQKLQEKIMSHASLSPKRRYHVLEIKLASGKNRRRPVTVRQFQ